MLWRCQLRVQHYSWSRIAVRVVAALIAVLGTAACQSKPLISGPRMKSFLYDVQIGMTREDVISRLGVPADRLAIEDTEFLFTTRTGSTRRKPSSAALSP